MKLWYHRFSKIGARLILCFALIILIFCGAFVITIGSLNKTQDLHGNFSRKTLPFLEVSQKLSESVFSYVLTIERLSNVSLSGNDQITKSRILAEEQIVKEHLEDLKKLSDPQEVQKIETLLLEMFVNTRQLESAVIDDLSELNKSLSRNHEIITNALRNSLRAIIQYKASAELDNKLETPQIIRALNDELVSLQTIVGQLNQLFNIQNHKRFAIRYKIHIRKVAKLLFQIPDQTLKKTLANNIRILSQQSGNNGFFSNIDAIADLLNQAKAEVNIYKKKQQTLHKHLVKLLEAAKEKINSDISVLNDRLDYTITWFYVLIISAVLVSAALIIFYINPRIIKRLNKLILDTKEISSGNYNTKIDISGKDEISDLSEALNNFKDALITKAEIEQEIKNSRVFLKLMMDNNPDLIFVKDEHFKIVQANQAFLDVYPREKQDKIIGFTTLEKYDPSEAEAFLENDKKAFEQGYSDTIETIHFPDGNTRILYTQKIRFENTSGKDFILGIGRDVTERENLIEKLTDSNEELERFAFVCSHDLQEPLRMIRSFSEKLKNHMGDRLDDDEKGLRYFKFVIDGATQAQNLIADILTYSSIDSDTQKLEHFSVENLIHTIKNNMILKLEEGEGQITFDTLPYLTGNKTQIYQLFQNLINNGLKYQKPGTIPVVHISTEDLGTHWQFAIKDNGIGIEERHLKKIFEVFQRLHRKDEYAGTGVGLSICKKVVSRHDGKIWAESEVGSGSTFYFTILKSINQEMTNEQRRKAS